MFIRCQLYYELTLNLNSSFSCYFCFTVTSRPNYLLTQWSFKRITWALLQAQIRSAVFPESPMWEPGAWQSEYLTGALIRETPTVVCSLTCPVWLTHPFLVISAAAPHFSSASRVTISPSLLAGVTYLFPYDKLLPNLVV